ncbi:MAG: oligosaccharide flippase family protein, partial [Chloroflexota bacterium]
MFTEDLNSDDERGITSLRRIGGNVASLLSSNVVNKATTFALYAMVARYLSAFEFGQMSLALTYFFLFQVLAMAGLETHITRTVA